MELIELNKDHLVDLLELYKFLHESDAPLPAIEKVEAIWNEIQSSENIKYYGVFESGKLISSCTISLIPNLTRGCRPYGVIENVVTHKEYRGKGYGRAVLNKALDHAWKNGCYKVMLMTGRLNEGTFKFYESVGFNRHDKQAFIAKPMDV